MQRMAARIWSGLPTCTLRRMRQGCAFSFQADPGPQMEQPDAPGPPQASGGLSVDPPPQAAWSADLVNSVSLTGTVLSQPSFRRTAGNQTVTNVLLGLRPRFGRPTTNQTVALEGWGYTSLQMAQHVYPGMQIQVEGQLRENIWMDHATNSERRKLKVVVERMHIISSEGASVSQQGGEAREHKPATLTPAIQTTHYMFQEQGLSFQQVAAARGVNISTAVDNVLKGAGLGLPLDWVRAASELQLGPQQSPWLTGDEVWQAVSVAHQEQFPGEEPTSRLWSVTLRRVRELLEAGEATMAKLGAQESMAHGKWVTYGQIKWVIVAKLQGVDWNAIIVDAPAVLAPPVAGDAPPF